MRFGASDWLWEVRLHSRSVNGSKIDYLKYVSIIFPLCYGVFGLLYSKKIQLCALLCKGFGRYGDVHDELLGYFFRIWSKLLVSCSCLNELRLVNICHSWLRQVSSLPFPC